MFVSGHVALTGFCLGVYKTVLKIRCAHAIGCPHALLWMESHPIPRPGKLYHDQVEALPIAYTMYAPYSCLTKLK